MRNRGSGQIEVNFYAAAREAAGVSSVTMDRFEPDTIAGLCANLACMFGPRMGAVLSASTLLVDGAAHSPGGSGEISLHRVESVDVLPPFAGG